jgi:MFS family permease
MQAAGFAWIVVLAGSGSPYIAYLPPFVIAGVGVSMAIPTTTAAALNAVEPATLGKASAIVNTLRQFGAVFGIAIATAIFNSRGSLASPAAVTSGYRPALAAAAGFSVLGALAALAVRRASRRADAPATKAPPVTSARAAETVPEAPAHPALRG